MTSKANDFIDSLQNTYERNYAINYLNYLRHYVLFVPTQILSSKRTQEIQNKLRRLEKQDPRQMDYLVH